MFRFFLFFCLLGVSVCSAKEKIDLAVCAIFQDDAKYIPEWVEFHQQQGVQKFYLYNNLSADNYQEILKPYIDSGLVRLYEWAYPQKDIAEWNQIQCRAYMDCIKKIRGKVTWCAFIDTDEFLFCTDGQNLRQYLKQFKAFAGLSANWVMYGTSGIYDIPKNQRMTDCLVYRAEDDCPVHFHVKTIARPEKIIGCENPHNFLYRDHTYSVTENKEPFVGPFSPRISFNKIRVNHYWARDGYFFETVKCARQLKWAQNIEQVILNEKKMNIVYDPISNYVH